MILTYLKSTKMESINARPVCQKSLQNYYRALENMINFSKYRNELIMVIQEEQILDKNTYYIASDGKINVQNLYVKNKLGECNIGLITGQNDEFSD